MTKTTVVAIEIECRMTDEGIAAVEAVLDFSTFELNNNWKTVIAKEGNGYQIYEYNLTTNTGGKLVKVETLEEAIEYANS